jgi:hypothetical protein
LGTNIGGSGGEGIVIGGEYNILYDAQNNKTYHGMTVSAGMGFAIPAPVEVHGEVGTTRVWGFNVFSTLTSICEFIRDL